MSSAKGILEDAVSFDTIFHGEAKGWKGTHITRTLPGKAKLVSLLKPASQLFVICYRMRELSDNGCTCRSACMNEIMCVKSAREAQSNFGDVLECLLTEWECCRGRLIAAQSYQHAEQTEGGRKFKRPDTNMQ